MHKKALLALLLVMAMMLSSCALIEKDPEADRATEIIRVGDIVYTKGQIQDETNYQMNYMAYYYSLFGMSYDVNDATLVAEAQQAVIDDLVQTAVVDNKAKELGMYELTAEEQAKLDANVEESWNYYMESVKSYYFADSQLTGEELDKAVEEMAANMGLTREYVVETETAYIAEEKLYQQVTADVTVTEEEIQAGYEKEVAADKEGFASYPYNYGNMVDAGTVVYYRPAGYRMVKQILVQFTEEDVVMMENLVNVVTPLENQITASATALSNLGVTDVNALLANVTVVVNGTALDGSDLTAEVTANFGEDVSAEVAEQIKLYAEAQAKLNRCSELVTELTNQAYANIDAKTDEILAQLAAGADWETLMAEKTEDPGMQPGAATAERGYAVCADTEDLDTAFLNAAMALEKVGDVSDKVAGYYGYYIIKYVADVEEGPVALEDVKDALISSLKAEKQETAFTEVVTKWVSEANVKIDYNALKN